MSAQLMGVLPLLTPTGGLKDIGGCGSGALSPEEAYFNGLLAGEVELGQYGLFFTGTNQGRLEKGMRALFEVIGRNDPEVIKALLTMAVRVQQRAAEEYRPERLAARLITNVYEPVLKRK
jgi:hypothetical protein